MIILTINHQPHPIENGIQTLLSALREEMGLTGTKEACGIGMCGACTVLFDSKPVSSCLMLSLH